MRRFFRFAVISSLVGAIVSVVLRNRNKEQSGASNGGPTAAWPPTSSTTSTPPAAQATSPSQASSSAAPAPEAARATTPTQPRSEATTPGSAAGTGNDMLVAIKGLGPKSEEQLRAAGIRTYDQLAAMSAPEIEGKLSPPPPGADFSSWIAQARDLARRRESGAAQP